MTKLGIRDVVMIGAGGHAKVCIELLRAMGENVAYCVGASDSPDECLGVPVLRGDENIGYLRSDGYSRLFVAIGSNSLRYRLATVSIEQGYQLVNAISPHSIISPSAKLGLGVAVMAGAVINADAEIGDLAIVNTGASIDHDCRIGQATHIAPQCALAGMVTVGVGGFMGIGSCAIPNVSVGMWSTIGAGAVVIKDIPDNVVAFGIPARQVHSF